jgi:hypothetical protein
MVTPSFSDLPDFDSELFEQVTDDELSLLECYRALPPQQRATVLEAILRMAAPLREGRNRPRAVGASPPPTIRSP